MKLAVISPSPLVNEYSPGDYHLILPDACRDSNTYFDFYKSTPGYKVLDNGAHETGESVNPNRLFFLAEALGVDEIVAPDALRDKDTTLAMTEAFEHATRKHPRYRYMGVVQGSTVAEAWGCLQELVQFSYLDSIGIPQHLCTLDENIRVEMSHLIGYRMHKPVHILGNNSQWPAEVRELALQSQVVGHDTTYPVKMGLQGIYINDYPPHTPRPNNYFELSEVTDLQDYVIRENIRTYRSWCNG